uniref:Uncharacterized protein n=1 Tax=Serinus canaria TaxID=9135 RepID=A0A8C9UBV9_SERCA
MDVPDSPERNPCSPEEEDQQLSDEEVLKESGSERELDGEGGQGSLLGEEEEAGRVLSRAEEENHSDEEDRLSEAKSQESDTNEQGVELKSPRPRKGEEEDRTNDLEVSSVTRELDEHELDYDEEVPEEPSAPFSPNGAPPMGPHPLMPANPWVWNLFWPFMASAPPSPCLQCSRWAFGEPGLVGSVPSTGTRR